MGHRRGWSGAVPMLLTRRNPDDVTRPEFPRSGLPSAVLGHNQPSQIGVCPSGWVCHAVRAPGSKVTLAPKARAGVEGLNSGSTRTVPVKYSAAPLAEGCEPLRLISIVFNLLYFTDRD